MTPRCCHLLLSVATSGTSYVIYPLAAGVARGGVEPPTFRFSGGRSYQLSYLAAPGTHTGPERPEVYRSVQ